MATVISNHRRVVTVLENEDVDISVEFILDFLLQCDPVFFLELHDAATDEPDLLRNRSLLLHWLFNNRYASFVLLEKISSFYETCSGVVRDITQTLMQQHADYLTLVTEEVRNSGSLEAKVVSKIKQRNPPKKRLPAQVEQQALQAEETVLKRVRFQNEEKDMADTTQLFMVKDMFSDKFDLSQYSHVKKKREKKIELSDLPTMVELQEVFQVQGRWAGEDLVARLQGEGKFALLVKKKRADEVHGYFVLSGQTKQGS